MIIKTTEQFIEDAKNIHGNNFDYSLVKYNGSKNKIKIICKHNHIFEQTPNDHLNGHGCKKCSGWGEMKFNFKEFLNRAILIHGNIYDYSKYEYTSHDNKSILICPIHGEFLITPKHHLIKKRGCMKCGIVGGVQKRTYTKEKFIENGNKTHHNKYNYAKVDYVNSTIKVNIICPIHGEFEQCPKDHIHQKQGCPVCSSSKGEIEISKYLIDNKIYFIPQYRFKNCKYKKPLPFDFFLPDYNVVIEFHGVQHYNKIEFWEERSGGFEGLKERDKIKREFCLLNNISYIEISHKDFNDIEQILTTKIKTIYEQSKTNRSSHREGKS